MKNVCLDKMRLKINHALEPERKSELGQFMTPSVISDFMASLFDITTTPSKLLDCGAGIGSLTTASIKRLLNITFIETWEIDPMMARYLNSNLKVFKIPFETHCSDFIKDSCSNILHNTGSRFTHAILNPPYKKIKNDSQHRRLLSNIGIETVNLYAGFLALTIQLMEDNGQIVAIVPRSFCNGPYYKPFRKMMLKQCSIEHIHVFEARDSVFKDDNVLQENIIIKLVKSKKQGSVKISLSPGRNINDCQVVEHDFKDIVKPQEQESFIHIPTKQTVEKPWLFLNHLKDLGLEVSTGPVVDFRVKDFWLKKPSLNSIPLLYPHHFLNGVFSYPAHHKKPNALKRHSTIEKWFMPKGYYVLVKRFSSKEEKRRVVSYVLDPENIHSDMIGFENHWNVLHANKKGIDPCVARGISCFLNSSLLDDYFRIFSGHTQVNATDLKTIKYPDLEILKTIGKLYKPSMSQAGIDRIVSGIL